MNVTSGPAELLLQQKAQMPPPEQWSVHRCLCSMPGVHSKDAGGEPAWLAGHWRKRDVLYWATVAAAVPVVGRALWWTAERGYNMVTPYEVGTVSMLLRFCSHEERHEMDRRARLQHGNPL